MDVTLGEASAATQMEKAGAGTLILTQSATYTGATTISAGTLQLGYGGAGPFSLTTPVAIKDSATFAVNLGMPSATFTLSGTNVLSRIAGAPGDPLAKFDVMGGTTILDNDNSSFDGQTMVEAGATLTATANGKLGGAVSVAATGHLKGSVTNGVTFDTGASLALETDAYLDVELATSPSAFAVFSTGALTINPGVRLSVAISGGTELGEGTYPLIAYSGALSGDAREISEPVINTGDLPYRIDSTANAQGDVVLLVGDDADLYWNGTTIGTPSATGVVGGAGTWTAFAGDINWTDSTGRSAYSWDNGAPAVFAGQGGGEVDVDSSMGAGGPITLGGMSFRQPNYVLKPLNGTDELELDASWKPVNQVEIEVDGTAASTEIAVALTGAGGLLKTGIGELVLSGTSSYTGGTEVQQGAITSTSARAIPGDIKIDAGGIWNWRVDGSQSFAGVISGDDATSQFDIFDTSMTGTHQLELSGNSSAFPGSAVLNTGTLMINGSAALGGSLQVADKAKIIGTGTFGDVTMQGTSTFTAGDGASTASKTNVNSLTTTSRTASFEVVVDYSNTASSSIVSLGDITINGGRVKPTKIGSYQTTLIPIMESTSGTVVYNVPLTVPAGGGLVSQNILVSGNTIYLSVRVTLLEDVSCGDLGLMAVQCSTFEGIKTLPDSSPVFEAVQFNEEDDLEDGLSSLSGDAYASMSGAMVANSHYLRDATGRHVRGALGGIAGGETISAVSNYAAETPVLTPFGAFVEENSGIGVWATGYGSWSRIKGEGGTATITDSAGGFYLGADFAAFDTMRFGAVVGYGQSSYEVDARNVTGRSDDFTLGVYGGGQWGGFGSDFGMAYTWHDVTADREIDFSTLSERERGTYDAGTFQVYGDLGYTFAITDSFQIEPYVDASYIHQQSGSFTEAGGVAALFHPESEMDTWFTTVGVRSAWEFRLGEYQSRLTAAAGWRAGFGDLNPAEQVAFDGGDVFGITGAPLAKNQGIVSVGFETQFTDKVSVGLNYTGQFGGGNESQNVSARLNIRF